MAPSARFESFESREQKAVTEATAEPGVRQPALLVSARSSPEGQLALAPGVLRAGTQLSTVRSDDLAQSWSTAFWFELAMNASRAKRVRSRASGSRCP